VRYGEPVASLGSRTVSSGATEDGRDEIRRRTSVTAVAAAAVTDVRTTGPMDTDCDTCVRHVPHTRMNLLPPLVPLQAAV
jgi:hypothetical protein